MLDDTGIIGRCYAFGMTNPNPATPAPAPAAAATPGSSEHVVTPPAGSTPPATTAPGNNNAGIVTLSVDEFAKLQRDAARGRSPKPAGRTYQRPSAPAASFDPNDPNASVLATLERERDDARRTALQAEVKGKVRDLLDDPRFKELPASTRKLVLDTPQALTNAETLEEAMYDIEDRLIELVGTPATIPSTTVAPPTNNTPAPTRETPPIVTPGAPAPVDGAALEDTAGLRGPARSQAAIRNVLKKAGIGVGQ